jgi:hypothetical protein
MNRIRKGLATAGFVAAMFGGGAIGAVALGATGGSGTSSTTTTTAPTGTNAPSTGTTTTPGQGSGTDRNCPGRGGAAASTAVL